MLLFLKLTLIKRGNPYKIYTIPILFRSRINRFFVLADKTASSTCGHLLPNGSLASNTCMTTSADSTTYNTTNFSFYLNRHKWENLGRCKMHSYGMCGQRTFVQLLLFSYY